MRIHELIEAKWAVGKHHKHATRPHQNRQEHHKDVFDLLWVNIKDVFANTEKDFTLDLDDPKGGPNAIGRRVADAKTHWTGGGYMDPSEIGVSDWSGQIMFSDGRHRMVAAHQMGQEYTPALVPKEDVDKLKKLVRTLKKQAILCYYLMLDICHNYGIMCNMSSRLDSLDCRL